MTLVAAVWDRRGRSSRLECQSILRTQCNEIAPSAIYTDGQVSLARVLTATLPEDRFDVGPASSNDGALACAADVRLDNRDDLQRALGHSTQAAELSDAMLIVRCFERWGEAVLKDFVGDFAIALWDRCSEKLLLARDFAGQRPLFFVDSHWRTAIASTATGLHALGNIHRGVNEQRAIQALLGLPENGGHSFFEGIERVEPGQLLTFSRGPRRARMFWSPPTQEIQYRSTDDYADALNEKLEIAVRARLRGAGLRVATHLSAGLDSSAVTAAAARTSAMPILAMTSVPSGDLPGLPKGRFGDEGSLAAKTAALYSNVQHRLIPIDGNLALVDLDGQLRRFERPDLNLPNLVWFNRMNSCARREGVGVMLTAAMGNATISYGGEDLLGRLLLTGRWIKFLEEFAAARANDVALRTLLRWSVTPLMRHVRFKGWRTERQIGRALSGSVLNRGVLGTASLLFRKAERVERELNGSVAQRAHLMKRVDPGSYNKGVLMGWNIDLRDPTADRRVAEFCLGVPMDQWFRNGMSRALARTALRGRVPESIRCARQRGLQSPDWFAQLSADRSECRKILARISHCEPAASILDIPKLQRMLDDWPPTTGNFGPIHYRTGFLRGLAVGEFIRIFSDSR